MSDWTAMAAIWNSPTIVIQGSREDIAEIRQAIEKLFTSGAVTVNDATIRIRIFGPGRRDAATTPAAANG